MGDRNQGGKSKCQPGGRLGSEAAGAMMRRKQHWHIALAAGKSFSTDLRGGISMEPCRGAWWAHGIVCNLSVGCTGTGAAMHYTSFQGPMASCKLLAEGQMPSGRVHFSKCSWSSVQNARRHRGPLMYPPLLQMWREGATDQMKTRPSQTQRQKWAWVMGLGRLLQDMALRQKGVGPGASLPGGARLPGDQPQRPNPLCKEVKLHSCGPGKSGTMPPGPMHQGGWVWGPCNDPRAAPPWNSMRRTGSAMARVPDRACHNHQKESSRHKEERIKWNKISKRKKRDDTKNSKLLKLSKAKEERGKSGENSLQIKPPFENKYYEIELSQARQEQMIKN